VIKMLFFDYRDFEIVDGLERKIEPPRKHRGNPVLVSDHPGEGNSMSFYGSVIRRPTDGLWQMWYTVRSPKIGSAAVCAESDDGIVWRRPAFDVARMGRKKTHIVFADYPHGLTVIYDEAEERPGWKYKLMAGAAPSHRISAYRSADGVHWLPAAENPVIGTNPDCPMSLHRARDGRYVLYCRPGFADRRVGRRESWDFRHWTEPRTVYDQEPGDHPQTQFYGLGATPYGPYEIGTLWVYHTDPDDMDFYKMKGHQQPELVYTRTGHAWRRAALGTPWIRLGRAGSWEWGNIQCASSPVLLDDEIRFYYVGMKSAHGTRGYRGKGPRCGIGFASMKPDRFVAMRTRRSGRVLTRPFWTETPRFFINARTSREGVIRAAVLDLEGKPIRGFDAGNCVPVTGDSTRHELRWRNDPDRSALAHREIRLDVRIRKGKLYALCSGSPEEERRYQEFRIPGFMRMELEKGRM